MQIIYTKKNELHKEALKHIVKGARIMDIGCGLRPMNFYQPDMHIMVEPCKKYVDILQERFSEEKNAIILNDYADVALSKMPDNHIDVIFMIDVIEHIEKDIGLKILEEAKRVCRKQVVIFTPLGFMPQEYEEHETSDAWGVEGTTSFQVHLSGWEPEEFDSHWKHIVCEAFHLADSHDREVEKPYGAFWGIYNKPKPNKNNEIILMGEGAAPNAKDLPEFIEKSCKDTDCLVHTIVPKDFSPYSKRIAIYNVKPAQQGEKLYLKKTFFKGTNIFQKARCFLYKKLSLPVFLLKAICFNIKNRSQLVDLTRGSKDKIILYTVALFSLKSPISIEKISNEKHEL